MLLWHLLFSATFTSCSGGPMLSAFMGLGSHLACCLSSLCCELIETVLRIPLCGECTTTYLSNHIWKVTELSGLGVAWSCTRWFHSNFCLRRAESRSDCCADSRVTEWWCTADMRNEKMIAVAAVGPALSGFDITLHGLEF
eukprot:2672002-Amphidinium_carterae.1